VRAHVAGGLLLTAVLALNQSRSMTDLFGFLILLATTASLVAYLACSLAAVKLRADAKRIPFFLLAALFSLWAIGGAGREAMLWGAALLLSGVPAYFIMRRNLLRGTAVGTPAAEAGEKQHDG
jgi:APA family basic amino acid/polyamine antiporter